MSAHPKLCQVCQHQPAVRLVPRPITRSNKRGGRLWKCQACIDHKGSGSFASKPIRELRKTL